MPMPRKQTPDEPEGDPYETYRDGNCRDASGQIVPCTADQVVSPAKRLDPSPPKKGEKKSEA